MSATFLMSELKQGDVFELVYRDGTPCGLEMIFERFDGEFAICTNSDPKLRFLDPVKLSVPGAMVRLIESPK